MFFCSTPPLDPSFGQEEDCLCCGYSDGYVIAPIEEHRRLCDKSFCFGPMDTKGKVLDPEKIYKARGWEGENNMGKLTMQLARFMTQECGWTLQVCDSGNLGCLGRCVHVVLSCRGQV